MGQKKVAPCAKCGEERTIVAREMCAPCYREDWKRGKFRRPDPIFPPYIPPRPVKHVEVDSTDIRRFWSKVSFSAGCWEWTLHLNEDGYGHFSVDEDTFFAHRVAYELIRGQIPDALELDHTCRNRRCVNPAHLEPVLHRENVQRGLLGRLRKGKE